MWRRGDQRDLGGRVLAHGDHGAVRRQQGRAVVAHAAPRARVRPARTRERAVPGVDEK